MIPAWSCLSLENNDDMIGYYIYTLHSYLYSVHHAFVLWTPAGDFASLFPIMNIINPFAFYSFYSFKTTSLFPQRSLFNPCKSSRIYFSFRFSTKTFFICCFLQNSRYTLTLLTFSRHMHFILVHALVYMHVHLVIYLYLNKEGMFFS